MVKNACVAGYISSTAVSVDTRDQCLITFLRKYVHKFAIVVKTQENNSVTKFLDKKMSRLSWKVSLEIIYTEGVGLPVICSDAKVCQMLPWRTKNWPHFINIWDTVTNVIPLCSLYQAPSYESNHTLLAPFPHRVCLFEHGIYSWGGLHYLSAYHLKNEYHAQICKI